MSLSSGELETIFVRDGFDEFRFRDERLNTAIELALLHGAGVQNYWSSTQLIVVNAGIYTGIVSVALWNICG